VTIGREFFFDYIDLIRFRFPVNRNETTTYLQLFELCWNFGSIYEKSSLIKSLTPSFKLFFFLSIEHLEPRKHRHESLCSEKVRFQSLVKRITQSFDYLDHWLEIGEMESESISVSGLIQVSTTYTVPNSNIRRNLSCYKLCQTTHTSHSFAVSQPVN